MCECLFKCAFFNLFFEIGDSDFARFDKILHLKKSLCVLQRSERKY